MRAVLPRVSRRGVRADEGERGPALGDRYRTAGHDGTNGRGDRQSMGAGAGPENDALSSELAVTADDRTGSAPKLSPSTQPSALPRGGTQTASFDVGDVRRELAAAPGAARLVVADGTARDISVVDPAALAEWSRAIAWLLSLAPAS